MQRDPKFGTGVSEDTARAVAEKEKREKAVWDRIKEGEEKRKNKEDADVVKANEAAEEKQKELACAEVQKKKGKAKEWRKQKETAKLATDAAAGKLAMVSASTPVNPEVPVGEMVIGGKASDVTLNTAQKDADRSRHRPDRCLRGDQVVGGDNDPREERAPPCPTGTFGQGEAS